MDEIKLTLDNAETPELVLDPMAKAEKDRDATAVKFDESTLTPEEKQMVAAFSEKIDLSNTSQILNYGSAAQQKVAGFSETALQNVRTKDLGEIGEAITGLVTELKGFSAEEEKGFLGIFKRAGNKLDAMKTKYEKAEVSVGRIVDVLENHQIQLMKDIAMLDKMYEMNLTYFKELSLYILAGKRKLEETRSGALVERQEKAKQTGLPEDAQAASDLAAMCDSFEKKLHDLELTRMVSIQTAPQIRLVQNNDKLMAEKIQSTIVNTIPLWKSQMVLALGLEHSQQAIRAQREVTDMTNALLQKNAEMLKMGTIETAKESERGVVDIETLQNTNRALIDTLDEVAKIQEDGRTKRREAEAELGRIEGELKQKLLEVRK